jgi:hypothetical protein
MANATTQARDTQAVLSAHQPGLNVGARLKIGNSSDFEVADLGDLGYPFGHYGHDRFSVGWIPP